MKIVLTCPGFAAHGGIRVILEWANRLAARGHEVTLLAKSLTPPAWFHLRDVRISTHDSCLDDIDRLIVCSPHDSHYLAGGAPYRRLAFMQMAEHLFHPTNEAWQAKCRQFYLADCPLILISRWNERVIRNMGRTRPVHYVGNGVNLDDFPLYAGCEPKTVLVEGWMPTNPTKDTDRLGPRVAQRLREAGHTILAYGLVRRTPDPFGDVPHEFHVQPSLATLNRLYERAAILIKATKYDARSCAPMEAMAKGAVPVRAIVEGDDDLVDGINCVRVDYDEGQLYAAARRVLDDEKLRDRLAESGRRYVQQFNWDHWMDRIEAIVCGGAA